MQKWMNDEIIDMELEGNLYQKTAMVYDFDNRDIVKDDIPFYQEYVENREGDVLELACGTGRVTLPLAENTGKNIIALDLSEQMLSCFQTKLDRDYRHLSRQITLIQGDISNFNLGKKFNTVLLPWRAFQYLTEAEQAENCLDCIAQHMTNDAIFIFDIFHPLNSYGQDWLGQETLSYDIVDPQSGNHVVRFTRNEYSDPQNQIIKYSSNYQITDKDGRKTQLQDILTYKYYSYQQIKDLLHKRGFTILEQYGYYDRSDVSDGKEFIFICKLRG